MIRRFALPLRGTVLRPANPITSSLSTSWYLRYCLSINVPTIAESVSSGVLTSWKKQVGEAVEEDEVIASIDSDKATVEVRAPKSGTVTKLNANEGAEVKVGDEIASIKEGAADSAPAGGGGGGGAAPAPSGGGASIKISVPTIAESVSSGVLTSWKKKEGESVDEDEVIASIDSDKATVEVRAPKTGALAKLLVTEGSEVQVGQDIADLSEGASGSSAPAAAPKKEAAPAPKAEAPKPAAAPSPPKPSAPADPVVKGADPRSHIVKVSVMRQRIADRLKASQNTCAMLTTFNEVDMTPLMQLRNRYKDPFAKKHGVKLGFMSPFTKAAGVALQEVPNVNASWNQETIEYHDFVDISVAVASPRGLVVPVLRDVQDLSLSDIEKKIGDFGARAQENKLTIPEMTGGTFTISNGGTFGSWMGTPIINPPQSAILGMHAIKKKPWVVDGKIEIRDIMALALTYDHRIIDGKDAVTFLVKIKNMIEDPNRILLDVA